ncbi:response regulator [Azospirillum canadense]|uniref:response regulator n=1 Tax=Azospirillum canadense TaxID=403962 RepID=UPI0022273635|nr:response regulator [Azospirillum canadense]MCW2237957.1 CheY-like chemotaxis protein [Azospirillum canadense]
MKKNVPHVLVAEDEVLCALSLSFDLQKAGYRATITHDGWRAIQADARDEADILLTDLQMPRLDGMDLIRCLRAKRPNLPVVIMTGRTLERGTLDEFRGPTMCISKPISDAQLFSALRSLLALSITTDRENRASSAVPSSLNLALS